VVSLVNDRKTLVAQWNFSRSFFAICGLKRELGLFSFSPQALFRLRKNYGKRLSARHSILPLHLKATREGIAMQGISAFQNPFPAIGRY
jgi:hypothetical protein